jgi:hypothetical protein
VLSFLFNGSLSSMCLTQMRCDAQWLEYMEACLSWDLGMGAAEASAAHEAIGARIARDATAVASFLRWQRYSQLLACQRAALPAQDASPEETCTTTHPRHGRTL